MSMVQAATGGAGNYDSTTLAYGSNVAAGNLLTCTGAIWNGNDVTSIIITDTVLTPYTVVLGTVSGGTPNKTWIARGIAPSSGANTVTINPNGSGRYSSHSIAEFDNIDATPLDVDGGTSTGSSATASDGITTSATNTLVIGVMSQGSGSNHALTEDTGGGWALIGEVENAGNAPYSAQYQLFTSAGAKTASWTIAASVAWCAQTMSFKTAAAGAASVPRLMMMGMGR
jgi:hypothetical protein